MSKMNELKVMVLDVVTQLANVANGTRRLDTRQISALIELRESLITEDRPTLVPAQYPEVADEELRSIGVDPERDRVTAIDVQAISIDG